jgi:hypothetical protein
MKRTHRVLVAAGVVLAVVGAGGWVGWTMWSHSPAYSMKEIAAAIQERDRYKFERYVDTEGVIQSIMADYTEQNPLAMTLANTMTASLKQQVNKVIEDGTINTESQFGYGLTKFMNATAAVQLERQGPNAYFTVPIKTKGGAPFRLRFHLVQVPDGYWRLDRATNVKDLISAEAAEEAARRAALEKELEEKLAKLEVVAQLHTSIAGDEWGINRINRYQVRFKNNADKAIVGMTGKITCVQAGFESSIRSETRLEPGETANRVWEFRVNQFEPETERMYAMRDTENILVTIDSLTFADGSRIKRGEIE